MVQNTFLSTGYTYIQTLFIPEADYINYTVKNLKKKPGRKKMLPEKEVKRLSLHENSLKNK